MFGCKMTFEMRWYHGFIAQNITTYHLCSVHCHPSSVHTSSSVSHYPSVFEPFIFFALISFCQFSL